MSPQGPDKQSYILPGFTINDLSEHMSRLTNWEALTSQEQNAGDRETRQGHLVWESLKQDVLSQEDWGNKG